MLRSWKKRCSRSAEKRSSRVSTIDAHRCVLFERLGFRDVRGRIEKTLAARLGLNSRVIVLSRREVAAAVQAGPFALAASGSRVGVIASVSGRRGPVRRSSAASEGGSPRIVRARAC